MQDWIIRPQIKTVPGVAGADAIGGYVKQFAVTFNQPQLKRFGLTLGDVEDAIKKNNAARRKSRLNAAVKKLATK